MILVGRHLVTKSLQRRKSPRLFNLPQQGRLTPFSSGSDSLPREIREKFDEILAFHNGVAAVREKYSGSSYHIDRNGAPIYDDRYKRTFGFYAAERAAVMGFDDAFFHIDLTGQRVYNTGYKWAGNFHEIPDQGLYRCPVRDHRDCYYYIDHLGRETLGPYSYAGDPNSAGHCVVQDLDKNYKIIDVNGQDWCPTVTERGILEACLPHKGIAMVRDENGWFYIDQSGRDLGNGKRYLNAEPHYNGQAKVRFQTGGWGVIDETGNVVLDLGESMRSGAAELEKMSKGYMQPLALKKILDSNLLQELDVKSQTVHHEILKDCASEMGLIHLEQSSETPNNTRKAKLLDRGKILTSADKNAVTKDRCFYWLQDQYLKSWLDAPKETDKDIFKDLAADPVASDLSSRVLDSYADADWKGAASVLSKLLHEPNHGVETLPQEADSANSIRTIVDMGGGHGSLSRELQNSGLLPSVEDIFCVDRPEVVTSAVSLYHSQPKVKYEVGSLFEGPLRDGDLYLLSRVLHDWPDKKASEILDRLRTMSPDHARLCVIDRVKTPENLHALLSLHMFALQGSHERCYSSWKNLFSSSGWQIDGREKFNGHEMYLLTKDVHFKNPPLAPLASEPRKSRSDSLVRKVVITVGGLGTRMNLQSAVTPKALLPIVSPTWEARPALAYLLDQLHDSCHSVDQVFLVSTPQYITSFHTFLHHYNQTRPATEGRKEKTVQIITQESARGFGDAVLAARQSIGDEPFLLVIGDHVFPSSSVGQMLRAYTNISSSALGFDRQNAVLSGVTLCTESEVMHTGLLRNKHSEYEVERPWLVHEMMEKPRSNYESFELLCGNGDVKFPSQLGIEILPPSIFNLLQAEKNRIPSGDEVDLRKVQRESLLSQDLMFGCLMDGQRLDIGNPSAYVAALQEVANDHAGRYVPTTLVAAEIRTPQERDETLLPVLALQQKNSVSMPDTLRRVLMGGNDRRPTEIHIGSSPGRMDVMCGFADYSGSDAIQYPTAQRVIALAVTEDAVQQNLGMIRLASLQVTNLAKLDQDIETDNFKVREVSFPTSDLFTASGRLKSDSELINAFAARNAVDRWELYLSGILHRVCEQCPDKILSNKDFTIVTVSDLPWNAGLASSAAVEVATAFAVGKAVGLSASSFEPVALSKLCKDVENNVVGAPCGILDQLAVTAPRGTTTDNSVVGIRCRMPLVAQPTYTLPLPEGLSLVALESGVERSTASTAYQTVQTSTFAGKNILQTFFDEKMEYLCDMTPSQFMEYEDKLPETLSSSEIRHRFQGLFPETSFCGAGAAESYPVRAATRFPIEENHRVQIFEDVLRSLHGQTISMESGVSVLGELMGQTHAGYRKCGLDTGATAFLVQKLQSYDNVVGSKLSGGGGGGAIVALVKDSFLNNSWQFDQLKESYSAATGLSCTLRRGTSGPAKYHGAIRRQFSTDIVSDKEANAKPSVLVVNHGYPPEFNGGSEVYAQMVALQLRNSGHCDRVAVFAREHNPYRPDFEIRTTVDELDDQLPLYRMNYSREAPYFRFIAREVDDAFQKVMDEVQPDIVHLHHMNHLSLNLPSIAKAAGANVVYTLHDYWLMCPRGQFLQTGAARNDPWRLCDGQENSKCATNCYVGRYASGNYDAQVEETEKKYWENWIASRMDATRKACENIDVFLAPSKYLGNKFIQDFSLPPEKIIVEPYGFFRDRLANRERLVSNGDEDALRNKEHFVFAYAGRHQPGKGINLLVDAALKLLMKTNPPDDCGDKKIPFLVKIFGRQDPNSSRSLQRKIEEFAHPRASEIFSWQAEYVNKDIVNNVFNTIDCLVVPSIWEENSPLVIHEAQQCRVPVITAAYGGMEELVKNAVNGLTFKHRSADSLADAMEKAVEQPEGMRHLGQRGYLYSSDGEIPDIKPHTEFLLKLFQTVRSDDSERGVSELAATSWYTKAYHELHASLADSGQETKQDPSERQAPWRVTFDTNPDDCNFSCTMCEQHSEYSPFQKERKEQQIRKRRMDFEIIRKTVEELAPKGLREIIPTTMGEPLYYKHFQNMLDLCERTGVKMNLTTNGSFYNFGAEYWANKIIPFGSDVKISWNGITQETQEKIMKGSKLDKQIDNLRKFVKIRNSIAEDGGNYCSVTLQLTFMEVNHQELPDLVKFAIEEDCDRVKGHHLWAHFNEIKDEDLRRNQDSKRRWNEIARKCREIAATHSRPSGRPFRLENFEDLDESQKEKEPVDPELVCPFLGKEAWVNHSGRFDPCCAPDLERKSLGSFGNINDPETSLMAIWNSDQYDDLVQNYTKKKLCQNCTMRRPPK